MGRSLPRAATVVLAVSVALTGVGCRKIVAPQLPSPAAPPQTSAGVPPSAEPMSPDPSTGRAPVALVEYVVGDKEVGGASVIGSGPATFTFTDNDQAKHTLSFVRLEGGRTVGDIQAALKKGAAGWPPSWAHVVAQSGPIVPRQTVKVHVPNVAIGDYALVDTATNPKTGKPYALDSAYVLAVRATDLAQ